MSDELSVPLPTTGLIQASTRSSRWLRATGIVVSGSLLAAVTAHVAVPLFFTPVPLTLAPFAVLLLGLLLTPGLAAATFAAYLLEGAAGLPVFAPGPAAPGLAHLFGPTGGYLLAYPLAAALISFLWRRSGRGFAAALASAAAGDAAILACGGAWLGVFTHGLLLHAATLGVLPFLPGDALKVVAAATLAAGFVRLRRRSAGREVENARLAKSGR
ncbi:MAG TPA: biotin transporter BioY [Terracidiphilus sp.]|jgi:biotin transport system substrate-specific component